MHSGLPRPRMVHMVLPAALACMVCMVLALTTSELREDSFDNFHAQTARERSELD